MSQIAFSHTHAALVEKVFAYIAETGALGTTPAPNPTFLPVAITSDIIPKREGIELDVRQLGAHTLYEMQTGGKKYGLDVNIWPFDLAFLGYGTKVPNYTTPAGTGAEALSFILQYKQSLGTSTLTTHWVLFKGFKCDTVKLSVSAQGLVKAETSWLGREIIVPTQTHGLGTPVIPDYASITAPTISNIDNGVKPLTINGVTYAVNQFEQTWDNHVIEDPYNGTGLNDGLTFGEIEYTGSFTTPIGQDLLNETKFAMTQQTGTTADFKYKAATMFSHMTGFKLLEDDDPISSGPTETRKHKYNFKCVTMNLVNS